MTKNERLHHQYQTLLFTCDRGVSHELVRHRPSSFCQESTRYCNYSKDSFDNEVTVIDPLFFDPTSPVYRIWKRSCENAEVAYFDLLAEGCTPQEARSVLPNSLKTELVMTANIREWRHFFRLRCAAAAHPQCREVALMALEMFHEAIPVVFDDLWEEFCND
jgi:thymidylate synthase (FAD)